MSAPRAVAPTVKICGLTSVEDAAEAATLGASHLGAIFAGGPRLVAPEHAARVFAAGRAAATIARTMLPRCVGVIGHQSVAEIGAIVERASLDVVQLHADPTADDVDAVRRATEVDVWAVLRIDGAQLPPHARELFAAADAVLLDAKAPGALGGTGTTFDWVALADAIAELRGTAMVVVAGGLTPVNVGAAVDALAPDVVDVSSGVESSPGRKDHERMRAFIAAASRAPATFPITATLPS